MQKKKKGSKKKSGQKNNQFARNLNIFIALAGLSYTIFLVFSKWSQIQQSMEIGGLSGLSMIHMPRMNITADKTESYVWYGSSTTPRPVTVKSTTRPIVRTISSTEVEDEIIIEEEEEEIVEYNEPIYPIDTLQISTESDCIEPLNFEQLSNIKPKYQTDANSFLVPILIWGPNNQIRGFIETIFLAIKLNRTLLIPPFFRHSSELGSLDDHATVLTPERVIDLESLAKIVSIAPYDAAAEKCNGRIQTVLLNRMCNTGPQYERLLQFESYTNLKFLKKYETVDYIKRYVVSDDQQVSDFFDAEIRPKDYSLLQKLIALHLPHDTTELQELYEMNNSPCAAWVFPYRAFDFRAVGLSRNWKHQTIAFENKRFRDGIKVPYPDAEAMRDIYRILRRPKPVTEIASKFISDVLSPGDYMAVHWRFEAEGGEYGGKVQSLCKSQNSRCDQIMQLHENPEQVASSLIAQLREWNLEVIYIAAPPDESNFIRHLIHLIRNEGSFRGYSGDDLTSYLPDCYTNDPQVFSSIEQEICSQSEGFLYSPGSSWSLNTAIERNCRMQTLYQSLESILEFGSTKSLFAKMSST